MSWVGRIAGFIIGGPIGGIIGEILTKPPYQTPDHEFDEHNRVDRKYGDVLCARRRGYFHFGVCSGVDSVIHFTDKSGKDVSSENEIVETDYATFKKNDEIYVLSFPEEHAGTIVYNRTNDFSSSFRSERILVPDFEAIWRRLQEIKNYKLYSPEETVERARRRLGEKGYDLVKNNCEHFAIWCKTGVSESHQVEIVLGNLEFLKWEKIEDKEPIYYVKTYKDL